MGVVEQPVERFDRTCRNHGSCPYCANNRAHNDRRRELAASGSEREDGFD
jgi:hypothetical protein